MESISEGEKAMQYPSTYEEALRYESVAARLVHRNMGNSKKEQTRETRALLEAIDKLVPIGRYEHFKSTPEKSMTYRVTGVIDDVNTGLCAVKYIPEYGDYKGRERTRILVGPDSWLRPVDRDGKQHVRFRRIPEDDEVFIDA